MENTSIQEMAKAEKREYMKKYRDAHKEKVREYNRRYWERRALKRQAEREESRAGGEQHDNIE